MPVLNGERWLLRALAGCAGICALGAQLALHAWRPGLPFPPYAVAALLVRHLPGWLATAVIEGFGDDAKPLLALAISGVFIGFISLLGGLLRASLVVATFSVLMCAVDPLRPAPTAIALVAAVGATAAFALDIASAHLPSRSQFRPARREFLLHAGALAAAFVLGLNRLTKPTRAAGSFASVQAATRFVAPPGFEDISGLSSAITRAEDHYVVDINFTPPVVDPGQWKLTFSGDAARPAQLSAQEILALPAVEQPVFLECVSNVIGGKLAGNALWTCVPLLEVLALAGQPGTYTTLVAKAADGYSAAIPAQAAGSVLVAVGMSGSPIPRAHGFPVRLLWPGHYGMLSVKWLTAIELTNRPTEGFWASRGWSAEGVLKTGSRIDVPERGAKVPSSTLIAGIAWAPGGVREVQVSIDDEHSWQTAELELPMSPLSWRRWKAQAALPPGRSILAVRAVDSAGVAQISDSNPPHPSGATGIHRVIVET